MEIKKIFKNWKINDLELYNELLIVNKNIITRWNIKTTLDKFTLLNKLDSVYNAYFFILDNKKIGFWLISNEDWEDLNWSNIRKNFQLDKENNYWLANFFIYPEFRWKWYWKECFNEFVYITNNKDFYLYTDKQNLIARKIYSKVMKEIWVFENRKIIYLKEKNEK